MEKKLVIYETSDGRRPFSEWLKKLKDRKARATIRARLERVQLGNLGNCESVGHGVHELKIYYGPGYRVYFGQDGDKLVVLLCGGDKKTQPTDVKRAHFFWEDYKNAS